MGTTANKAAINELKAKKPVSWMSLLPEKTALKDLPMPGGHHALTLMSTKNGVSQDIQLPKVIADLMSKAKWFDRLVKHYIKKWAQAQQDKIDVLLKDSGLRYLDIRLAKNPADDDYYTCHGLYSNETFQQSLQMVKKFMDAYPQEIVILDCRKFFGFNASDHANILELLEETFGNKIASSQMGNTTTLGALWKAGKQVIIVYHDKLTVSLSNHTLWPAECLHSMWANKSTVSELMPALEHMMDQAKDNGKYNVSQVLLTPTVETVIVGELFGWLPQVPGSLKQLGKSVRPSFIEKMQTDWQDRKLNVIAMDAVGPFLLEQTQAHYQHNHGFFNNRAGTSKTSVDTQEESSLNGSSLGSF